MTKFGRSLVIVSALGLGAWACSSPAQRNNTGGTGGEEETGGAGTGGAKATGGSPGTGGSKATGGAPGTGGATGGSPGTGGASETGGAGGSTGGSSGGADAGADGPPSSGGPLSITVDHVPDPAKMRLCFKPEATNSGGNHSPKIDWTGLPEGTKSLILTTEDLTPTAVCHQIICNIPPTVMGNPADAKGMVPMGAETSYGHANKTGWYGPGAGMRNYEIKIWALATDKFEGGCSGTGTAARGHCARLKGMAGNKAVVLGTASKVLTGQASGTGCP
jgi:phosphatidylethanolamine-binding protein (PEBP) family uncharacterized protein